MQQIFKACDIRGLAVSELTDPIVRRIGLALGTKWTGQQVVVGGDVRLSTPRLRQVLSTALVDSGCQVIDIGTVATPVFYFALQKLQLAAGVMITASHNPAPYNGFKLVFGTAPVTEDDISQLGMLVEQGAAVTGSGSIHSLDVTAQYLADTAAHATPGRLRVVIDAGNGAASLFAPQLFRQLGYEVIELFCNPDGNFPNRPPNPALAPNLVSLAAAVLEYQAAVGIAFDGDGDRVGFVDETGQAADNDDVLVLLARDYLAQASGAIVYDAKCSLVVPEEITLAGGRPVMARAGHTFSKAAFQQEQALLAGEISGHFFLRERGYDDALLAGLKVATLVERQGALSQQLAAIPNYYLTPDIRVPYPAAEIGALMAALTEQLAVYRPNCIDGVRLEFADGWAMIRSSVTEPLVTLRFEAKTPERLGEIAGILLGALPKELCARVMALVPLEFQPLLVHPEVYK